MRHVWLLVIVAALAGCTDAPAPDVPVSTEGSGHAVTGFVRYEDGQPAAAVPITLERIDARTDAAGFQVVDVLASHQNTTSDDGSFTFTGLANGTHRIAIQAPGFQPIEQALAVPVTGPLSIVMTVAAGPPAYTEPWPFSGYVECALEAFIITPSCDSGLQYAGADPLFQDDSVYAVPMQEAWQTAIIDVSFDAASHPGIAGLRVSVYAEDGDAEVLSYERVAQGWRDGPFTLRIDAGADYGGARLAPTGVGDLRLEFFPHGHGDDTVCDPVVTQSCFLGVGATTALEFEAITTVFYNAPAPDGWTLLA